MLLKFSIGFEFHLSNEKHYELKSFQTNLISLWTTTNKRGEFFFTIPKKRGKIVMFFILESLLVSQYPFSLESNFWTLWIVEGPPQKQLTALRPRQSFFCVEFAFSPRTNSFQRVSFTKENIFLLFSGFRLFDGIFHYLGTCHRSPMLSRQGLLQSTIDSWPASFLSNQVQIKGESNFS